MRWQQAGWTRYLLKRAFVGATLVVTCICGKNLRAEEPQVDGFEVFLRDWSKLKGPRPFQFGADGLGPLYNAVSCVECHGQGGTGGAGSNKHNVQLLTLTTTIVPEEKVTMSVNASALRDRPIHPGLKTSSSIVLHRFSVNPGYEAMLLKWLEHPEVEVIGQMSGLEGLGITPKDIASMPKTAPGFAQSLAYVRTERNTPSLYGLGKIDGISTLSLQRLAEHYNNRYPELSGKVAPNGGKFGWRGQTSSVRNFVLGACANELGLQTKDFPQPADPSDSSNTAKIRAANGEMAIDMTDAEITALVSYVEQLPAPLQVIPETEGEQSDWLKGRAHFSAVRCDSCHVKQIGSVVGIYSDLLLHDMGEKLNDPAALAPPGGTGSLGPQYYGTGTSLLVSDERKQEWRTPPLWGIRDTSPYLHDGRAPTIEAAIQSHGGEATVSRRLFEELSAREQRQLVRFVKSIGAPESRRTVASAR